MLEKIEGFTRLFSLCHMIHEHTAKYESCKIGEDRQIYAVQCTKNM